MAVRRNGNWEVTEDICLTPLCTGQLGTVVCQGSVQRTAHGSNNMISSSSGSGSVVVPPAPGMIIIRSRYREFGME